MNPNYCLCKFHDVTKLEKKLTLLNLASPTYKAWQIVNKKKKYSTKPQVITSTLQCFLHYSNQNLHFYFAFLKTLREKIL